MLELAFYIAAVAFVYAEVLIQPGHILHGVFSFLQKKLTREIQELQPDHTPEEVRELPGYKYTPVFRIHPKKHWLLKPLGECVYCTAGHLAMWVFAIKFFLVPFLPAGAGKVLSLFAWWITVICLTILMVLLIKKLYEKWSTR